MPMRFQRSWDFDPGNKPVFLNDFEGDTELKAAILLLLDQIVTEGTAPHADSVQVDPIGGITATDVQNALAQLDEQIVIRAQATLDAWVGAAPAQLDTLDELAAALNDDANFATTVTAQIGGLSTQVGDVEAEVSSLATEVGLLNTEVDGKVTATGTVTKIAGPMTQAAYDALTPKAADTLYVIVG